MKKNFKIKMTSLFLAIIFVIALPISISAQTVDIPSPNSEVQPQSFTREYTTYLTSSTRQVMSDGNWFGEELVIVVLLLLKGQPQYLYTPLIVLATKLVRAQ